jgi:hypothetical protein
VYSLYPLSLIPTQNRYSPLTPPQRGRLCGVTGFLFIRYQYTAYWWLILPAYKLVEAAPLSWYCVNEVISSLLPSAYKLNASFPFWHLSCFYLRLWGVSKIKFFCTSVNPSVTVLWSFLDSRYTLLVIARPLQGKVAPCLQPSLLANKLVINTINFI